MTQRIFLLSLVLAVGGCHPTFRVVTDGRFTLETPHGTTSRIITETPPVNNSGPVVEMPLGNCSNSKAPKIAIVDVDGLLLNADPTGPFSQGENPVAAFHEKLTAIAEDACVKAVVVRINSPGGGVTATDIMWHDLQTFREQTGRPVVACLMDLGTGGAYYLATASDQILAHPTTVTGGIGVILNLYNLRDAMAYFNIVPQAIKSGPQIDMGTTAQPLTPEARKLLQEIADEFHERFQRVVEQARPGLDRAPTTFDGRVFTAAQALQRRLIDRIGYLDDAVGAAKQLAQLNQARVVLFHRGNDPAYSPYAITPNVPLQTTAFPISVPGLDRSRLPSFLYLWQPEATLEKLGGK